MTFMKTDRDPKYFMRNDENEHNDRKSLQKSVLYFLVSPSSCPFLDLKNYISLENTEDTNMNRARTGTQKLCEVKMTTQWLNNFQ